MAHAVIDRLALLADVSVAGLTDGYALVWDATAGKWRPLAVSGGGGGGTPIDVPHGGTGATTLTGIVKGSGTSPLTAATEGTDYLSGASAKLPLSFAFGGTNANATGDDLGPRHYVSYGATAARLILSTDANASGTFTVRVMRSADGGATFPDTVGTVSLTAGNRGTTTTTVTTPSLNAGDWLRVDVTAVSGTVGSWMLRLSTFSQNQ